MILLWGAASAGHETIIASSWALHGVKTGIRGYLEHWSVVYGDFFGGMRWTTQAIRPRHRGSPRFGGRGTDGLSGKRTMALAGVGVAMLVAAGLAARRLVTPRERPLEVADLVDSDSEFYEVHGLRVHVKRAGEGRPVLVLLHGFGASVFSWRKVMGPLAEHCHGRGLRPAGVRSHRSTVVRRVGSGCVAGRQSLRT